MWVLYVRLGSKVRPRTFGCFAMGSAIQPYVVYFEVQIALVFCRVVLSGFSLRLFCLVRQNLYVGMVVCISRLHSCFCV